MAHNASAVRYPEFASSSTSGFNVYKINQAAQFTRGTSCEHTTNRVAAYVQADQTQAVMLEAMHTWGVAVPAGAITGAIIGGVAAGPQGALIGGLTGAGAGFIIGAIHNSRMVVKNYDRWLATIENTAIIEEIRRVGLEHPALQNFMDMVYEELFTDPRMAPCGHTYNEHTWQEWFKSAGGHTCPYCRAPVMPNQLILPYIIIGGMKKAYAQIAQEAHQNRQYPEFIQAGFKALSADMEYQANEILKQTATNITTQLNKGQITPLTYLQQMRGLEKLFPEYQNTLQQASMLPTTASLAPAPITRPPALPAPQGQVATNYGIRA